MADSWQRVISRFRREGCGATQQALAQEVVRLQVELRDAKEETRAWRSGAEAARFAVTDEGLDALREVDGQADGGE